MSTEQNKALVHRIFETMNANRPQDYDQLIDPEYVNHDFPAPAPGLAGFKMVDAMFRSAFPDLHVVVEEAIAEGDRVVTRGHFTGTHRGAFMGVPASGKTIKVGYIDVWRIANGRGRENWVQMNLLGLMQQIGAAT